MTREELDLLNRRISELREPMPTAPPDRDEFSYPDEMLITSPGKSWYWILSGYEAGAEIICVPRNWTGDETATAVLLEEMPSPKLWRGSDSLRQWNCNPDAGTYGLRSDPDRKVAVAKAWVAWKESQAIDRAR